MTEISLHPPVNIFPYKDEAKACYSRAKSLKLAWITGFITLYYKDIYTIK